MPEINSGSILTGELALQPPGALLLAIDDAPVPPRRLFVRVTDDHQAAQLASWSSYLNEQDIELQIINDQHSRPAWLARADLPSAGFNLLTGPYAIKNQGVNKLHRLLPLTGLAAALVILLSVNWILTGLTMESEYSRLQGEINGIYSELFPDARNLVDPRHQMEQSLIAARLPSGNDGGNNSSFLSQLERVSGVIGQSDNLLEKLHFDESGLMLEVSVPDYKSLEELQSRLSKELPSRLENAELKDGRVYARLVMRDEP
jgi:type II secretion system protein L